MQTLPPLYDFEQWIDTEIKESDKRLLQGLKEWDAERLEILEKRRREEAAKKEYKEEEERRRVATHREEGGRSLSVHASESSDGGESRCPEEGKVVSLHPVVSITC